MRRNAARGVVVPIVAAPLRKQVIELLRAAIISFEYEPGQRTLQGPKVIETLAGRKIHAAWVVPGGVDEPLTEAGRCRIQKWLPEAQFGDLPSDPEGRSRELVEGLLSRDKGNPLGVIYPTDGSLLMVSPSVAKLVEG